MSDFKTLDAMTPEDWRPVADELFKAIFRPREEWPKDGLIAQWESGLDKPAAVLTWDDVQAWLEEIK